MSILPNSQISLLINKQKLTIFEKIGENGKVIDFNQSKEKIVSEISAAINSKQSPNKQINLNLIFGSDLTFIYSSKKSPSELFVLSDQVLPYTTDEAEYFVSLGKAVNTLFACPNPVKNLLYESLGKNLIIIKNYPLIFLFSPKYLIKIPNQSRFVLTVLEVSNQIFTMVNFKDELVDFQIYSKSDINLLINNLVKYYNSDPDFNIQIDTIVVNSETNIQFDNIRTIRLTQNIESIDSVIISNFHKAKHPTLITLDDVKKQESGSDNTPVQSKQILEFDVDHPQKNTSKLILIIVASVLFVAILGAILFAQFQSTKSKNVRKNGTVAPSVSTTPTIIPSKKFSQPKTAPQIEIIPATQSAQ